MAQIRVRRKAVADVARRHISIGVRRRLAATATPPAVYIPVRRRSVARGSGAGAGPRGPASGARQQVESLGRWAKLLLGAMILVVLGPLVVTTCARLVARETAQGLAVPSQANEPVDVDEVVDGVPVTSPADPGAEPDLPTLTTEELVTNLPFGQPERLVGLAGKRVWLTRARIQGRASDRAAWIGPRPDRRMLVVLPERALTRSDEQDAAIEAGRAVDVRGAIRRLPVGKEMLQGWRLSAEDLRLAEEGEVYLHVDDVRDFRIVGDP